VLVAKASRLTSGEVRDQHLVVVLCRQLRDGAWTTVWETCDIDESGYGWIPAAVLTGDPDVDGPGAFALAQRVEASCRAAVVRWRSTEVDVATPDALLLFVVWRDETPSAIQAAGARMSSGDETWTADDDSGHHGLPAPGSS
jgi:hypothetical protein